MANVIAWTEIEGFSNIRKYTQTHPEILHGQSKVTYKAKVKLHGMNHAVQVYTNGDIVCQSRTTILTSKDDNAGFAKWVEGNKEPWLVAMGYVIFGEWVGPGIQKGVALADLPKKIFAVFGARPLDIINNRDDTLIVKPDELLELVEHIPDVYVIPWYSCPVKGHHFDNTTVTFDDNLIVQFDVDWNYPDGQLTLITSQINEWVSDVEKNDPWVEANFGIKGTGEGLVFYPTSEAHVGYINFTNLTFKAKGEAHKNIKTAKPAQVNPESAASVDAFVDLVLTDARLAQGSQEYVFRDGTGRVDPKSTGKFVQWILADVQKEAQDELAASNLEWKQVQKPLSDKARTWYLEKSKI
jgi:RNA ligase